MTCEEVTEAGHSTETKEVNFEFPGGSVSFFPGLRTPTLNLKSYAVISQELVYAMLRRHSAESCPV
eukprot:6221552-Lingulodinium_polyedra.AAC.1